LKNVMLLPEIEDEDEDENELRAGWFEGAT
jgi:hypothetical protein